MIDCSTTSGTEKCGEINLLVNFSDKRVHIDVQYPTSERYWYTVATLAPNSKFEAGPISFRMPVDTLLRAQVYDDQCKSLDCKKNFMLGRINSGLKGIFSVPKNAFKWYILAHASKISIAKPQIKYLQLKLSTYFL